VVVERRRFDAEFACQRIERKLIDAVRLDQLSRLLDDGLAVNLCRIGLMTPIRTAASACRF
jgi:hypothetical protein